jgi:hypothetical protein
VPSFYSVVRYVPDPVADERINVGVVVHGEGRVLTRFVNRWARVKGFGGEDLGFLKDFAAELDRAQREMFGTEQPWTPEALAKFSKRWTHSIQMTEPRASLKPPADLLNEVASLFLREAAPRQRARDKRVAVSAGIEFLDSAIKRRFQAAPADLLRRRYEVPGKFDKHRFDIAAVNGKLYFAAEGLSFENADSATLRGEVDALAWAVDDVLKKSQALPIAVLALPPMGGSSRTYTNAKRTFRGLGASFIAEKQLGAWARSVVKTLPTTLAVHS